ncbi:hypothetical protein E2562_000241 [Oryza meyeriana var. granulata]|uniref:Uncharacterized protein n=1 Tax=Oryza meyeriana var. granulata TaxID=110450 RepID=A0A6G1CLN9_9ORYZ|nr:hypothetical protein E2562_000241 [Oryza meyeriana var. granulata]
MTHFCSTDLCLIAIAASSRLPSSTTAESRSTATKDISIGLLYRSRRGSGTAATGSASCTASTAAPLLSPSGVLQPLLLAVASLGSLDTTLRQFQLLQHLLNAINSNNNVTAGLMVNLAATNAMANPTNNFANFQEHISMLVHVDYEPDYLRDVPSFAEGGELNFLPNQ